MLICCKPLPSHHYEPKHTVSGLYAEAQPGQPVSAFRNVCGGNAW